MTYDYLAIASEIKELENLLAAIPEGNVIERMSLESRLESARAALAVLPQQIAPKARLTFRGKPVFGSHGIAADFGGKAAGAFSDAFAAVVASLSEGLRYMGPIPNRDKNQLLITGTAIGSFGFEFELPALEPSLFPETEKAQEAMAKIEALFRLTAEGTDDEVAEVIEEVHPRAVKKVYEFLEFLVQQQAWCGLEFADRFFRYADYEQIKVSSERLQADNIQEWEETHHGEFQGVLPTGRTFEFRLADQKGLIKGKVDLAFDDPDILNREWLHKPVTVKLNVMRVGQGRPRFTLMTLDDLSAFTHPLAQETQ
ncbi:MAG: hypothetical protein IE925_17400 [Rhodobacterales bacterium]|nr:hypothetical protein [Rhodobacterales bacterium]